MGITHKLIPQIKEFIIDQKKSNPGLSCRSLSQLIDEKFQIKVSKSSINGLFKEAGLSMPVGRRIEGKRKLQIEAPALLEDKLKEEPLLEIIPPVAEPILPAEIPPTPAPVVPEPQVMPTPEEVKEGPVIETPLPPPKIEEPVVERVVREFEKIELQEASSNGVVFLKAADYLLSGNYVTAEVIRKRLNRSDDYTLPLTEAFAFMQLPGATCEKLEPITGIKLKEEDLNKYVEEAGSVKNLPMEISLALTNCLEEIRCLKVSLSDGSSFYLDTQMHSVWSTPHIPYDFSSTLPDIKRSINDHFFAQDTLFLFMAPGYDTPSKDLFNFISGMEGSTRKIARISLVGNRFEDIDLIAIENPRKYNYVFAAWPWQFVSSRKVNKLGEFKAYRSAVLKKDVFCASLDIDFINPESQVAVNLKGCAMKLAREEKTRMIILSNLTGDRASPEALCESYFSNWPNMEEAFQDYSRKIELFTYTAQSQAFFASEYFALEANAASRDLKSIADNYIKTLDSFLKWHLLPQGYEKLDFLATKSRFYDLKALLKKEGNLVSVSFELPPGYAYLSDLQYLCRRLNERNIRLANGTRLSFQA